MNKQDIDKASGQLQQAIRYFAPMIDAMNHASDVFDSLANAIPLQNALSQNIAELKSQVDSLALQVEEGKNLVDQQDGLVAQAKEEAKSQIASTKSDADKQIADILASIEERTKAASDEFSVQQTEMAETIGSLQKNYASSISALQNKEQALQDAITALEAKLDSLKQQAQKFAAAFAPE